MKARYYIIFGMEWLEDRAKNVGFQGTNWKDDVLADLLDDGALIIWKGQDLKDTKSPEWYIQGKRLWVVCKVDGTRSDSFFCLRLNTTQPTSTQLVGNGFRLEGRWAVGTLGSRRPESGQESIEQTLNGLYAKAGTTPPLPKQRTSKTQDADSSANRDSPFQKLKNLIINPGTQTAQSMQLRDNPENPPLQMDHLNGEPPKSISQIPKVESVVSSETASHLDTVRTFKLPDGAASTTNGRSSLSSAESLLVEQVGAAPNVKPKLIVLEQLTDWNDLALQAILYQRASLRDILIAGDPLKARRQKIATLEAELARIKEALEGIPDEETVAEASERRRALAEVGSQLQCPCPIRVSVDGSDQLLTVLKVLASEVRLRIPSWVWGSDRPIDDVIPDIMVQPRLQARLIEANDWIQDRFAGAPPLDLESLPFPNTGTTVSEMLDAAWKAEEEFRELRQSHSEDEFCLLKTVPRSERKYLTEQLAFWKARLHQNVFEERIRELLERPLPAREMLPSPERLSSMDDDELADLKDLTAWVRALKLINKQKQPAISEQSIPTKKSSHMPAQLQKVEHVVTDQKGHLVASPVQLPEPDRNASYVLLDIPVRFVANGPIQAEVILRITSNGTASVPQEVLLPSGRLIREGKTARLEWPLTADTKRWQAHEGGNVFREECIGIPVTLGFVSELRNRKQTVWSVEFELNTKDKNTLQFNQFPSANVNLGIGTGQQEETASQLITHRALGPQEDHQKLEGLLTEGRQAFMVVAPRRFGKTTLFEHLAAYASAQAKHDVVTVTLERDLSAEQGYHRVWQQLRETLEKRHKSSPALGSVLPSKLEDENAWGNVRTFIKDRGFSVLHLLIDEAQVLVPRTGGEGWGHRFKNFVEGVLSKPQENQCMVQVCLFGTVDLSARMGQNCRDFLLMHGTEQHVFKEASLARFLRAVSQGVIVSSRRARELMVHWTNNLRTLYALLDFVRSHLVEKQRIFLLDRDVEVCIQKLLAPENSQSESLWDYVRAELSHRDEWEPVDAFPLAVAWAHCDDSSFTPLKRLEASVRWLENELAESGMQAIIVRERVDSGLRDLKARGVLRDDGSFWRPILREMILRKPGLLRSDPGSYQALLRLTVDSVSYPESLEQRDQGGQATVHFLEKGQQTLAYRICALESQEDTKRFSRTCAAIRVLRSRLTRLEGDRYLPRVSEAGFAEGNPKLGIIVYDWIEGDRMDRYPSELPWDLRLHIVKQVAYAVQALHARDVIHCDIAPRNILISSRMEATLIDFGLARRTDTISLTHVGADPFKAPELQRDPLSAGKEVDIYALGALLAEGLSKNSVVSDIKPFVKMMMAEEPSQRPAINAVVEMLREQSSFDMLLEEKKRVVEDKISDAPEWLWEELMSGTQVVASALAGRRSWDRLIAMESAFLLNNIFARIVDQEQGLEAAELAKLCLGDEISLARVGALLSEHARVKDYPQWVSRDVKVVGHLRNAKAHPTAREAKLSQAFKLMNEAAGPSFDIFRGPIVEVARHLDRLLGESCNTLQEYTALLTGAHTSR